MAPREASDRLVIYQNHFDTLHRKFVTYTGGEELFGLPVTQYPDLLQVKKELNLLQKLYGLYNDVIDTVNGYYDVLWGDVNIEKINQELQDFQTRSGSWGRCEGHTNTGARGKTLEENKNKEVVPLLIDDR